MSNQPSASPGRVLLLGQEGALPDLSGALSEAGYEVTLGLLRAELGSALRRQAPNAVVIDARGDHVPSFGQTLASPVLRHVPVLILTSAGGGGAPHVDGGPLVEFVDEPITTAHLVRRIAANVRVHHLLAEGQKRSERSESLLDISRALNSTLDSGAILYMIARQLSEAMELVRCSFIVPDLARGVGNVIACKDDPNIHALEINLANYPEIIQVLRTGKPVVIADVDQDPIMAGIRKFADVFRDQSIMTVPLRFHDEIIGVLQIRKKSQRKGFTPREIEYGELLANAAANALKNAQLYEDIEKHNFQLRRQKRELEELSQELRRKNQELIELQRLKEDFTAMVVHDLRSPLMIVQGVLDILHRRHGEDSGDGELLRDGTVVVQKILALIENLLEVSRMESGEVELRRDEIELKRLVTEAVAPYQFIAADRSMTLATEVAEDLPTLWVDRRAMVRVLDNLIANAFSCTPDGGAVKVCAFLDDAGADVRIEVQDNGRGISAEELPHIFKKFHQGRGRRKKGSGLGLTIVDLSVRAHGGTVVVDSKDGEGSRFIVRLPVGRERLEPAPSSPLKPA